MSFLWYLILIHRMFFPHLQMDNSMKYNYQILHRLNFCACFSHYLKYHDRHALAILYFADFLTPQKILPEGYMQHMALIWIQLIRRCIFVDQFRRKYCWLLFLIFFEILQLMLEIFLRLYEMPFDL